MHQRLTIVRPPALGVRLALAVNRLSTLRVRLESDDLARVSAHLAAGDFETVRALLRDAPPAPALPLVVARYVTWSGDLQTAAAVWSVVLRALDSVLGPEADAALRHATAAVLQRTATDLGDSGLAAILHRHAREDAPAPQAGELDPDVKLICDIAHHVLGIEPDASRGRLRLRPRLGSHDALEARHIRFADASISMSAVRAVDRITFRVEQDAGGIPLTVLLEPFVDDPGGAEIDGRHADLVPETVAGGVIVPVQLVLDEARTLIVHTGPR